MALYDAADLLARVKASLNRPTVDEALSDAQIYSFLTEAQMHYTMEFAARWPEIMYGAPTKLTTADNGKTYTFGAGVFPIGMIELKQSLTGPPLRIGAEFDPGADFTLEGDTIRVPGNRSRTFADGPYARFITPPSEISGSTAPTLEPPFARILLVHNAAGRCAIRLGLDPNPYAAQEAEALQRVHETLATQYWGSGRAAFPASHNGWWYGIDTGAGYGS